MRNRLLYVLVLVCILGSTTVSSFGTLSYTFKSIVHGISMTILIIIGLGGGYYYLRKHRRNHT